MDKRGGGRGGAGGGTLGVRKNPKKRSSRRFVKAVVDYLISDSYMYAPLIDSPPLDSPPSAKILSSCPAEKGRPVVQFQRLLVNEFAIPACRHEQ